MHSPLPFSSAARYGAVQVTLWRGGLDLGCDGHGRSSRQLWGGGGRETEANPSWLVVHRAVEQSVFEGRGGEEGGWGKRIRVGGRRTGGLVIDDAPHDLVWRKVASFSGAKGRKQRRGRDAPPRLRPPVATGWGGRTGTT